MAVVLWQLCYYGPERDSCRLIIVNDKHGIVTRCCRASQDECCGPHLPRHLGTNIWSRTPQMRRERVLTYRLRRRGPRRSWATRQCACTRRTSGSSTWWARRWWCR
eukprot:3791379-Pleurochrysis_carterae.AAC.1